MRHPLRWIAFGLYVVSLFLPVFSGSDLRGFHLMLFGVVSLLDFQWEFAMPWLANILFLTTYLFRLRQARWVTVLLALFFASFAFFIKELPGPEDDVMIAVTPLPGFYLWYGSFLLLLLDAALGRMGVWPKKKVTSNAEGE